MAYRVTAPYVTVPVIAVPGAAPTALGFYKGAVLPATVVQAGAKLLVTKGMVEIFDPAGESDAAPADADSEPPTVKADGADGTPEKPAGNASKAAWVAYAVAVRGEGVSEDDARAEADALTQRQLAAKYAD